MPRVDTVQGERVTLQSHRLAIIRRRHTHVSNEHGRQTPEASFPYTESKRQGLSITFRDKVVAETRLSLRVPKIMCFPTSAAIGGCKSPNREGQGIQARPVGRGTENPMCLDMRSLPLLPSSPI